MIVNFDVKSLEIVVAAHLSKDPVMCEEIIAGDDIHQKNKIALALPERKVSKIFIFRLIYGGSAYSYSVDPDFISTSNKQSFWQDTIDKTYEKYSGLAKWHDALLEEAQETGRVTLPNGVYFPFVPDVFRGEIKWPLTTIKNYPVQGYGAQLVQLARLEAYKMFKKLGLKSKLIGTVHDSIVADCPDDEIDIVARIFLDAVQKVPSLVRQLFKDEFILPLTGECLVGPNKLDMIEYKYT